MRPERGTVIEKQESLAFPKGESKEKTAGLPAVFLLKKSNKAMLFLA